VADAQITNPAVAAGASVYEVPRTVEFTLKTVNALFTDNGAAGDWLPAVVIRSDAGLVIARAADQAVLVSGGDDAEVSWFPGVKNTGAGFRGLPEARASGPSPSAAIPSGVVQTFQWGSAQLSGPTPRQNSAFHFVANPVDFDFYVSAVRVYVYTVRLEWTASFAGDRYVEISVPASNPMPQRLRVPGTPQGDVMILSGVFEHGNPFDQLVTVNVFQASGAAQDITDLTVQMVAALPGP
jgi:hypothetical protein